MFHVRNKEDDNFGKDKPTTGWFSPRMKAGWKNLRIVRVVSRPPPVCGEEAGGELGLMEKDGTEQRGRWIPTQEHLY